MRTLLKNHVLNIVVLFALAVGVFAYIQDARADAWCPRCSSDFCQGGGGDYLLIVGGSCYCCVEVGEHD